MENEYPNLEAIYDLLHKVQAENENCARDIASIRLELEQIKVQKTLLSGSLQEKVEENARLQADNATMRALMVRLSKGEPNLFTGELCFYPEGDDFLQLIADLRAYLAEHPQKE